MRSFSDLLFDLLDLEDFQRVSGLDVRVVLQADTALLALFHALHLLGVVVEGLDLAGMDDDAVADDPDLAVLLDFPFRDVTTGDAADPGNLEDLADIDGAEKCSFSMGLRIPSRDCLMSSMSW